ncbi:hypothetical protein TNCV_317811 [Trichonephila clavipes]|nr:hypothetical protein TNCV_317811 [Trichonephila clavipes]
MKYPEATFSRLVQSVREIIEIETVAHRVLPLLLVLPVVKEEVHEELVDFAQGLLFRIAMPSGRMGIDRSRHHVRTKTLRSHHTHGPPYLWTTILMDLHTHGPPYSCAAMLMNRHIHGEGSDTVYTVTVAHECQLQVNIEKTPLSLQTSPNIKRKPSGGKSRKGTASKGISAKAGTARDYTEREVPIHSLVDQDPGGGKHRSQQRPTERSKPDPAIYAESGLQDSVSSSVKWRLIFSQFDNIIGQRDPVWK